MDNLEPQFEQHIAEALAEEGSTSAAVEVEPARALIVATDARLRSEAYALLRNSG